MVKDAADKKYNAAWKWYEEAGEHADMMVACEGDEIEGFGTVCGFDEENAKYIFTDGTKKGAIRVAAKLAVAAAFSKTIITLKL